jgi:hypothetical protein
MFASVENEQMMRDFSKRILVEQNFYPEFLFHVLHAASGKQRYHVSVTDRNKQNVFFAMEKRVGGSWKIIDAPKAPGWIITIEKRIEEAIVENLES